MKTLWFYLFTFLPFVAIAQLTRGPYLQQMGSDQVTIRWRSSTAVPTAVGISTNGTNWVLIPGNTNPVTHHSLSVTGLLSRTEYHYRIENGTNGVFAADPDWKFRTAPVTGENAAMRFWALGDFGTASADARAVRDAFKTYNGGQPVDAWLMLGDMAYDDGSDSNFQTSVFNTYPDLLATLPAFMTRGNHERDAAVYYDVVTNPTQAELGGVPSNTEAYYSYDYGNIHFICLDSFDTPRTSNGLMMDWLESELLSVTSEWVIAIFHHPPYTKASHDSDDASQSGGIMRDMREVFIPVLEAGGVDLVLSGHSHAYERSYPIHGHYGLSSTFDPETMQDAFHAGDPAQTASYWKTNGVSTVYVVNGSGGQLGETLGAHPVMATGFLEHGSMIMDVFSNRLEAVFLNKYGVVRDRYVMEHRNPEFPAISWTNTPVVIGSTQAQVEFVLSETGINETVVSLWVGEQDGGTSPAAWDRMISYGPQSIGHHAPVIDQLNAATQYWVRLSAANADGTVWTTNAVSFVTGQIAPSMGAVDLVSTSFASVVVSVDVIHPGDPTADLLLAWSTTADPGSNANAWNTVQNNGTVTTSGVTQILLQPLPNATSIYIRAALSNFTQVVVSDVVTVSTLSGTPSIELAGFSVGSNTVLNTSVVAVTGYSATLAFEILPPEVGVTNVQVWIGDQDYGTISTNWPFRQDFSGNWTVGVHQVEAFGLQPLTNYSFRFQAEGLHGTDLSSVGSFATTNTLPSYALPSIELIPGTIQTDTQTVTLVPAGSAWRYRTPPSAIETNWYHLGFDDRDWPRGHDKFGYGEGDEVTLIPSGPSGNRHLSVAFRRPFLLNNTQGIEQLDIAIRRDDGFILFLNGEELLRDNLPPGPLNDLSSALLAIGGAEEDLYAPFIAPTNHLTTGTNWLSARIYQHAVTSSDLAFSLRVDATRTEIHSFPSGVVEATSTNMHLGASVTSWGWQEGTVTLVWGAQEAGTNLLAWQNTRLATNSEVQVSGLNPGTNLWFRFVASNEWGSAWTEAVNVELPPDETDSDLDGVPDAWELNNFGRLDASNGRNGGDFDLDGLSDFGEWKAGTSPTDGGDELRFTLIQSSTNLFQGLWPQTADPSIRLFFRTNLNVGTWTDGGANPFTNDVPVMFLRLQDE